MDKKTAVTSKGTPPKHITDLARLGASIALDQAEAEVARLKDIIQQLNEGNDPLGPAVKLGPVTAKPRTLSPKHLAALQAGRRRHARKLRREARERAKS